MSSNTVELEYPLTTKAGVVVKSVTLRRPKVRDMKNVERFTGEIDKSVHLISHLAELTPEEVSDLDVADFRRLSEVVEGFLERKVQA